MTKVGSVPGFAPDGAPQLEGHVRPGATVLRGGVRFEVWAPYADAVEVVLDPEGERRIHALSCAAPGDVADTWTVTVAGIGHGALYRFRLHGERYNGAEELADPASRHQPDGVFGPSAVLDAERYTFGDELWRGVELADTVLYELHVGTFTDGGTLDSAIAQLPRLAALGVTVIELMPVAQFSGERGWGYDGVFPNAVQHTYGGPDALARFVAAAHRHRLGVVLDVVYNHFGPEGNVTGRYGDYVTDRYHTPWGGAVNFSERGSDQVRRLFIDNSRQWICDFHVDGLRLDAVHAIVDPTARPFLEELNTAVHDLARHLGRSVLTFLESSDNDPRLLMAPPLGTGGHALWNDEYHHALRVALTGSEDGYYADFTGAADVAEVLERRWCYRGRYSEVRGRRHGRDAVDAARTPIDANRFVVFDQNHDQVGNRRDGERLDVLVEHERRKLALAAVLLSPFTPMLFMGEEYGETAPFPYFVDHRSPELLASVRRGRAAEFAGFDWEGEPPDPAAMSTFLSAVLHPEVAHGEPHAFLVALSTELLRLRRGHPLLHDTAAASVVELHGDTVVWRRRAGTSSVLVALRFSDDAARVELHGHLPVLVTAEPRWGGAGAALHGGGGSLDGPADGPADQVLLPGWSCLFASRG